MNKKNTEREFFMSNNLALRNMIKKGHGRERKKKLYRHGCRKNTKRPIQAGSLILDFTDEDFRDIKIYLENPYHNEDIPAGPFLEVETSPSIFCSITFCPFCGTNL